MGILGYVEELKALLVRDESDADSILKGMYDKEALMKKIKNEAYAMGFTWFSLGVSFNTSMLTIEGRYIPGGIVEVVNDEQLEEVNRLQLGWLEYKEIFNLLETKGINRLSFRGDDCIGLDIPEPSKVAQAFLVKKEGIIYKDGFYYRIGIVGTLWRRAMSGLKHFIELSFSDVDKAWDISHSGNFMRNDRSR